MTALEIRWDEAKERANRRKHGISFREAATAFADEHALVMPDPDHSQSEDRFLLLGLASSLRLLVVAHCFRDSRPPDLQGS